MPEEATIEQLDGLAEDPQLDTQAANDAAEQFLAATREELANEQAPVEAKATPPRGPDGKFLKKDATSPQESKAPAAPVVEPPAVDPVWAELAKQEGIDDETIATFKTEAEVEAAIQTNRVQKVQQAAQTLGMTPQNYAEFMQWKNGQSAPQGQPPPAPQVVATPADDTPIEFTEDEFSPEQIAKLKPLVEQLGKAKAALTATQKLQSEVDALKAEQQRVVAAQQAQQQQAVFAESWDKAAERIPGFKEYFGKPSELLRLAQTQPNHQRVRDYVGFDAHFQPIWQTYVNRVGENDTALYLAIRDAWSASPYSKIAPGASRNGTNGTAHVNGSVVRQGPRRTQPRESLPANGDVGAEMDRTLSTLTEAWDAKGENPFKNVGV